MGIAFQYREMAETERRLAAQSRLPNQRDQHLRAAEKWEILAEELERVHQFERHPAPRAKPTL